MLMRERRAEPCQASRPGWGDTAYLLWSPHSWGGGSGAGIGEEGWAGSGVPRVAPGHPGLCPSRLAALPRQATPALRE